MKNFTLAAGISALAAGLSATVLGLAAPALAAPSGSGSAQDTISQLEADGNRVIVNRLSDAPLAQADVVSVRPGADLRSTVRDFRYNDTYQQVVTGKVYYVDVK
jgi:hypothetical protein